MNTPPSVLRADRPMGRPLHHANDGTVTVPTRTNGPAHLRILHICRITQGPPIAAGSIETGSFRSAATSTAVSRWARTSHEMSCRTADSRRSRRTWAVAGHDVVCATHTSAGVEVQAERAAHVSGIGSKQTPGSERACRPAAELRTLTRGWRRWRVCARRRVSGASGGAPAVDTQRAPYTPNRARHGAQSQRSERSRARKPPPETGPAASSAGA